MIDAAHVDAAAAKLFAVERRSLRRDPQRAPEARQTHRLQCRRRNEPEQFDRALGARAEGQELGEFDERGQHLRTRSHPLRRASSNELLQQLDPEIDLVFGDLETWRERE